jgi:RNA polymerase sigma factor (sigma-70 family)
MELPEPLAGHFFRRESGRMVATLTRIFGPRHLGLAEDAVQDALLKALEQWPHSGVPANPSAWLIQVAKYRAVDLLRREAILAAKVEEIARPLPATPPAASEEVDDQLAMMFLCCHPSIPRDSRVALTLKAVGGFGTGEIARAFLIREAAAAQRIVRAKRLIRDERLEFEMPESGLAAERRDSVLETLYLMFNEGYASGGEQVLRHDLCEESVRLACLVADHPSTRAPECDALVALFLLQAARFPSRVDAQGDLSLLPDQDRSQWDRVLIGEGLRRLERSAAGDRMTAYHLEAGIAAAHATAPDFRSTDWGQIVELYTALYELNPSPVVALNRAVAISLWKGSAEGLREVAEIEKHPSLENYHLLHATLGRLWREAGDRRRSGECFERALDCECSAPERRFLERQLRALQVQRD